MANKYAGTKTEKNLWEAFAGESQARNKYTYFASVAKKAGYEQIAEIFLKTALKILMFRRRSFRSQSPRRIPSASFRLNSRRPAAR